MQAAAISRHAFIIQDFKWNQGHLSFPLGETQITA